MPPLAWWIPVAGMVLLIMAAESLLPHSAGESARRDGRAGPGPELVVHLIMFSGTGALAAGFLALYHRHRCLGGPPRAIEHDCLALLAAGAVLLAWLVSLVPRLGLGEETLAVGLVVYLPSLSLTFAFAAAGLRRLRTFWPGVVALAGLTLLNFLCQLASLNEQGRPRDELVFALPSVPIVAAVVFWLAVDARSTPKPLPRPSP